jgi:hypothetical protein
MKPIKTDLPFKISQASIAIVRGLPVFQCECCTEYLLEDSVTERVKEILTNVDATAEPEIIKYAA